MEKMTKEQAIQHIETLYPPDSQFPDIRATGRWLMDENIGNSVGYNNWRNLPEQSLKELATINLLHANEHA